MEKQSRKKVLVNKQDWISRLPDEIIILILSVITLREAARTSILSHRWRYLWKGSMSFRSSLHLDVDNIMETDYSDQRFRKCSRITVAEKKLLRNERLKFVRRVDQILRLSHCSTVNSFRIRFYLGFDFTSEIDRWLQTAIVKRAEKVDIDLSEFCYLRYWYPIFEELYHVPEWVFVQQTVPFLKYLSLCYCICDTPRNFSGFKSLKELRLVSVWIFNEKIGHILSNCSCLERLSLINCWKLDELKIAGELLALKHLIIAECYSLGIVEIDAINLTTFEYYGIPVGFSFQNVPQLVNVVIFTIYKNIVAGITYALGTLSTDIPQMKSLLLHALHIERKMIPKRLSTFGNLKQLVLIVSNIKGSVFGFFTLLESAPYLHTFELHLSFEIPDKKVRKFRKPSGCCSPHLCLKEVVFSGLVGSEAEVEFAKQLVSIAEVIETVTIYYVERSYKYDTGVQDRGKILNQSVIDATMNEAARIMAAESVGKHIESVLPLGAKLIIMK